VGPVEVGRDQPYATRPPEAAQRWSGDGERQGSSQAFDRDGPRGTEWSSHVLVVDEGVDQTHPAAEQRRGAARGEVGPQELDQLSWLVVLILCECDLVESVRAEPGLGEAPDEVSRTVFLVADDVRGHIPDPPPSAQARLVPLVRAQRLQEVGHLGAFCAGHRHHIHGSCYHASPGLGPRRP